RVRVPIGHGSFGTVVKANDIYTDTVVAVKLLHKHEELHDDINKEQDVYRRLSQGCDPRIDLFAQVYGSGTHQGFHCIVFELCHSTLYDVLAGRHGLTPLPARHVLEMGFQLASGLDYLHSLGIAHTDMKPDNIGIKCGDTVNVQWLDVLNGYHKKKVLVCTQLCILDLGNAHEVRSSGNHGRVGAKTYRAPEVVLGLPWSYAVDAYGLGCVLAEIYLEENLVALDIDTDLEQLATIDSLLGPFPREFAMMVNEKSPDTFTISDVVKVNFPLPIPDAPSPEEVDALRRLEQLRPVSARIHSPLLCDLICKLMAPDPAKRLTLAEAKKHEYFDALHVPELR
ncbi:kinase-like protein, partial [Trametes sanguinea]